ncbi:MAG: thiamine biosynthesis protein [Deltaproteobacteria bacterium]|nr:thiamine biosynthesis protein [Candidatus Zymogenaceae bacterium]
MQPQREKNGTYDAVSLLSGGLDGILATRIVTDLGVQVLALHCTTPFFGHRPGADGDAFIRHMADRYGFAVRIEDVTDTYMKMLSAPEHGYGGNFNPCIDCKILMMRRAREVMEEVGGRFIVSGEVLGQRPMSQRRDAMRIIERDGGVEDILLRPLSAKLFGPTLPEREGWVDRERLFDFSGRTRKPQMALAEVLGVTEYPSPAGGCCLTDPIVSGRIRTLFEETHTPGPEVIALVRIGRPFRLPGGGILSVGRNQEENGKLEQQAVPGDLFVKLKDIPGPLGIIRGGYSPGDVHIAGSIVARYAKVTDGESVVIVTGGDIKSLSDETRVFRARDEDIEKMRF